MRSAPWLTCLWPGLAPLWWQGRVSALAVAVVFACMLNGALAATLLWPQSVNLVTRLAMWLVVASCWLVSFGRWRKKLPEMIGPQRGPENDRLFCRARDEYLQGHWYEAETLLNRLLKLDPDDVDARLCLATLCRRRNRAEQAKKELEILEGSAGSAKWLLEFTKEKELLDSVEEDEESTLDSAVVDAAASTPSQLRDDASTDERATEENLSSADNQPAARQNVSDNQDERQAVVDECEENGNNDFMANVEAPPQPRPGEAA